MNHEEVRSDILAYQQQYREIRKIRDPFRREQMAKDVLVDSMSLYDSIQFIRKQSRYYRAIEEDDESEEFDIEEVGAYAAMTQNMLFLEKVNTKLKRIVAHDTFRDLPFLIRQHFGQYRRKSPETPQPLVQKTGAQWIDDILERIDQEQR
jgi:hypothetical protein